MQLQITSATSPKSFSEINGMIKNKPKKYPNHTKLKNNDREWVTNSHILSY